MDRSRNLIIILIVIILILIIALVGAMVYIFMNQNNNNNNNEVVVDNSSVSGNVVDSEDEEDANNISNTVHSDEELEIPEESEQPETPEIPEETQPTQQNNNPAQGTDDMDKLIFNTTFISYDGNINGDRLNSLLQVIQDSNTKYPEHQITLSSNNLSNLNGIVSTDIYTITLSYGDDGYINNINIDKQIQ